MYGSVVMEGNKPVKVTAHTTHDITKSCETYRTASNSEKVSEYDQEIPQSRTADNPMASREEFAIKCSFSIMFYSILFCFGM